jgi:type IV secretion system protein VirB6
MVAIATKVVVAVAGAFWATAAAGSLIGLDFSDGFAGIALQQGGIGILLTVLLISTPPMAASFFQGTLGGFSHYTAWQAGAGQRPGEAGYRGGSSSSNTQNYSGGDGQSVGWGGRPQSTPNQPSTAPSYANNPATNPNYGTTQVQADVVKTSNRPRQE